MQAALLTHSTPPGCLQAAQQWFQRCCAQHPDALHPFLLWNCMARAGASQYHGHAQVRGTGHCAGPQLPVCHASQAPAAFLSCKPCAGPQLPVWHASLAQGPAACLACKPCAGPQLPAWHASPAQAPAARLSYKHYATGISETLEHGASLQSSRPPISPSAVMGSWRKPQGPLPISSWTHSRRMQARSCTQLHPGPPHNSST